MIGMDDDECLFSVVMMMVSYGWEKKKLKLDNFESLVDVSITYRGDDVHILLHSRHNLHHSLRNLLRIHHSRLHNHLLKIEKINQ